jgi:hypothetical protein
MLPGKRQKAYGRRRLSSAQPPTLAYALNHASFEETLELILALNRVNRIHGIF